MGSAALKNEAINLISRMSDSKIRTVIQFVRFMDMQKSEESARDERDFALINASASQLNEQAEETLDFQTDIWGDE